MQLSIIRQFINFLKNMSIKYTQYIGRILTNFIGRFFLKAEINGLENFKFIEKNGGNLFIANHSSLFDSFLIGGNLPWPHLKSINCYRFMTYYKYVWMRLYGFLLFLIGAYAVWPKKKKISEVLKKTVDLLKNKSDVLIFPTGKLDKEFDPSEARPGVAYLAKELDPFIMPVYIENSHNISFIDLIFRKRKVKVFFGKPFKYGEVGSSDDELSVLAKKIAEKITQTKLKYDKTS